MNCLIVAIPSWLYKAGRSFALTAALVIVLGQSTRAEPAHEVGRVVYNFRCYFCHGYSGDARTLASRFVEPRPRDFTALKPGLVSRDSMIDTVARGRSGTAMKPFAEILPAQKIAAVVDFIRSEFMDGPKPNTRYHTPENGWPNHQRYASAFPFASGEILLDTPWEALNESQRRGRRLYFNSCISCHDRSSVKEDALIWERQALSYPRFDFRPGDAQSPPDTVTGATPFSRHDIPLRLEGLTSMESQGNLLFLANCAFCHGADGTGKNWIGGFLRPHPRDLTDPKTMAEMTRVALRRVIRNGMPGTSMPAWGAVLDDEEIGAVIAYISRAFHPILFNPDKLTAHSKSSGRTKLKFIPR